MLTRLQRREITIKDVDVQIEEKTGKVRFKRQNSELEFRYSPQYLRAKIDAGVLNFEPLGTTPKHAQLLGTAISISSNHIQGLTTGYTVNLEIHGTGYKVASKNENGATVLVFQLGYSKEVVYKLPSNVTAKITSATLFSLESHDKQAVYQVAAHVCRLRKRNSYKKKGVIVQGSEYSLKETKKK